MKRRDVLSLPPALSLLGLAAQLQGLALPSSAFAEDGEPFDRTKLIEQARKLAEQPYQPPQPELPAEFAELTFDQYRQIRYRPERRLWEGEGLPFTLDLMHSGFIYRTPTQLFQVVDGRAQPIRYDRAMFEFGAGLTPPPEGAVLPFSGFRARTQLNHQDVWDEFLVFQGASYFRAIARHQVYGLSARGLAVRTAHPDGEEFPAFTAFWIERPQLNSSILVVHALLDSPSCTGAYRFTVRPGDDTVVDVELSLFARAELDSVGFAPLTSMYLFGPANRAGFDDFRDAVHDSDGLVIMTGAGERIWRPLTNPSSLQVSAFGDRGPLGFGLVQRARQISDYEDLEARYDIRPSVWIEAVGDWGEGQVELIEIPSTRESNDNIVVFWRPRAPIPPGGPLPLSYRMRWAALPGFDDGLASAVATRMGRNLHIDAVDIVIDFDIQSLGAIEGITLEAGASSGRLLNQRLMPMPERQMLRAAFELDPQDQETIELRARLMAGDRVASETWLYRWTSS